mmetsp:Transcript_43497/g.88969  ORF Transcript_43497/g.88969 Transcript_43497/m.88969 type:complete len:140 (+) Transcript_43497:679-1098(+)
MMQDPAGVVPESSSREAERDGFRRTGSRSSNFRHTVASFVPERVSSLVPKIGKSKPEPKKKEEVYQGEEAVMLYSFNGAKDPPFPPDDRKELTCLKGQKLDILEMRDDGWCLVKKPTGPKEYWLPGNYLSVDGRQPYYK